MLELLEELAGEPPPGCDYAEARFVEQRIERLRVSGGQIEGVTQSQTAGIGVRVAVGGAFGFAATGHPDRAAAIAALERAREIARAQPAAARLPLAPVAPARGHWAGPCRLDPFARSLEERLTLLLDADAELRADARIVRSEAEQLTIRTRKAFASSDGGACTQELTECGGAIAAVARDDGDAGIQVRSYPAAHGGSTAAAGYEHVLALDLPGNARRVAEEALELLTAPPCPAGRTTLVLGDEQLALQIHESIGHALELDRILLGEASYAGTSWVSPSDLGTLRYGSPLLRICADGTLPGALGSFGWDDEGVGATRAMLIDDGILKTALSDRRAAAAIGLRASSGCARADGFARQPIVRMTNVSLEPGEAGTLEELLDSTGSGIYMETNRSWSIDDRRLHFQFGTELAREIKNGRLGRLLRNPTYAGMTPRFWNSLDAVCSPPAWRLWGLLNCGKGEPGQVAHVSHGAAPARFRDVEVGCA